MAADHSKQPIVHFVGSIPLPDGETVFRTLAGVAGPYLRRLPDGETGIRKTWIRFLQGVLAENPAIEVAQDVPPFKFTQWDGKVLREIPRLHQAGGHPRSRHVRHGLCRDGDRVVGGVRAPAKGRCHSRRGEVSGLAPDADSTNLQQHGAVGPSGAAAGAHSAFDRRGRQDRRGPPQRPHRGAMGCVPGSAGLGRLLRTGDRSTFAAKR